jgi:prepilin-type N-terminal cleavage/methylation domain-containing protein/prepilin-type processing-associated H-X9-DG protein
MEFTVMRKKGFTLIELLVVIAIIALLLSILMPALSKVKEIGKRIVCGSLIRQMGIANRTYAMENDGQFVYYGGKDKLLNKVLNIGDGPGGGNFGVTLPDGRLRNGYWCLEETYLSMLGMTEDQIMTANKPGLSAQGVQWPDNFLCPSYKELSAEQGNPGDFKVSYGYNQGQFFGSPNGRPPNGSPTYYKDTQVRNPSGKLMFSDSQSWYLTASVSSPGTPTGWGSYWGDANYKLGWDREDIGHEQFWMDAGVMYRHSEGANVAFYDGHAGYMPKEEMFFYVSGGTVPDHARNTHLWELWK